MRGRVVSILALVSACAFEPAPRDPGEEPVEEPEPEPEPDPDDPPIERTCEMTDPALRLCLDFEEPADVLDVAYDGSGAPDDAWLFDVARIARTAERAIALDGTGYLQIAESDELDLPDAFTIEMWVRPDEDNRFLLDNNRQYSLSLQKDLTVRCAIEGAALASRTRVPRGNWTHVACRYNETQMRVYIDGDIDTCGNSDREIQIGSTLGTLIGADLLDTGLPSANRFVGQLDNVRVYSRALTNDEICRAATGGVGCDTGCGALIDIDLPLL